MPDMCHNRTNAVQQTMCTGLRFTYVVVRPGTHTRGTGFMEYRATLRSFRLDVGLADDVSILVILVVDEGAKLDATPAYRIEPESQKLRFNLECVHCGSEPSGEFGRSI